MQTLHPLIPPAKLAAVKNALQQTFNTATVTEITLLAGGLSTSSVFKIEVAKQHYVLKVDSGASNDQDCMHIAAWAGVAPPVYYKAEGITITAFIKSTPMQSVFKTTEALLPELAKTIKRIHALPLFPVENSLLNTVDGLIAQFKASRMLTGPALEACFAYYEEIKKHYPWDDTDRVSSHNDLNPNNLVFDGEKIWVIDWDAAFANDRYVDLAITANFYVSNDEQENIFLEPYFDGVPTKTQQARFFLMRQVCRIVYAMLMFKLADTSKPINTEHNANMENITLTATKQQLRAGQISLANYDGQLLFGKALINEALESMRSARFGVSVNDMK